MDLQTGTDAILRLLSLAAKRQRRDAGGGDRAGKGEKLDEGRLAGGRDGRNAALDADPLQRPLGKDSGDDDRGEQQPEHEEEQVVARIGRREADADGQARVPAAHRSERQPALPGRRHSGTGTCSTRSRTTRSAASSSVSPTPGPRPASTIRCARTGTQRSLTSSGSTYARPRSSARARATASSAMAPRGDAPSEINGVLRVA